VGSSVIADNTTSHAFLTGPNGVGIKDLGTLGGAESAANGVNDYGQVVGWSDSPGNTEALGFITGRNGVGMTRLGALGGTEFGTSGNGINNLGRVVGYTETSDASIGAFITGPNGTGITNLDTLNGYLNIANAINNSGLVVGNYYPNGSLDPRAFITGPNGTEVRDLDLGMLGNNKNITASSINDYGQVAGSYYTKDNAMHAYVTGANGSGVTDIGTGRATGINDFGQVIGRDGWSAAPFVDGVNVNASSSFLYSNGERINLSLLDPVLFGGWLGLEANAINDKGQITGTGYNLWDGGYQAFLLSPDAGSSPGNPILPVVDLPSGWQFDFMPNDRITYIDPTIAIGYDYMVDSGSDFTSVVLPNVGDGQFNLYVWNGSEWTFDATLSAGVEHTFGGLGVDRFRIMGIETSAALDPSSPTAFVTGLHFAGNGQVSMHMIPITTTVPEPQIYAILLIGLSLIGAIVRFRKKEEISISKI
jgi:probable HAF family extracellular repeat protein